MGFIRLQIAQLSNLPLLEQRKFDSVFVFQLVGQSDFPIQIVLHGALFTLLTIVGTIVSILRSNQNPLESRFERKTLFSPSTASPAKS